MKTAASYQEPYCPAETTYFWKRLHLQDTEGMRMSITFPSQKMRRS